MADWDAVPPLDSFGDAVKDHQALQLVAPISVVTVRTPKRARALADEARRHVEPTSRRVDRAVAYG